MPNNRSYKIKTPKKGVNNGKPNVIVNDEVLNNQENVVENVVEEEMETETLDEEDMPGMMKLMFGMIKGLEKELKLTVEKVQAGQKQSETLVSAEMAALGDKVERQLEQQTTMVEGIAGRLTSIESKFDKNQEAHLKLTKRVENVENQIKKGGGTSNIDTVKALENVRERKSTTDLLFIESFIDAAKMQSIDTEWDKTTTTANDYWFSLMQELFPSLAGCYTHLKHDTFPLPGKKDETANKLRVFHPSVPAAEFFRAEIARWRMKSKTMMAGIMDEENPRLAVAVIPGAGKDDRLDRKILEQTLMKIKKERRITSFLVRPYFCHVTRRHQWTASIRRAKAVIPDIAAKIPSVFTAPNRIGALTIEQLAQQMRTQLQVLPEYIAGEGGEKRKDSSPTGVTPTHVGKKSNTTSATPPLPLPTQNLTAAIAAATQPDPPTAASG